MSATLTLLDLAGAVALLMWGLHMVQTGITRALGADLRRVLGRALGNRASAFMAGLGITALLQSSTATGLMATSFAATGLVDLVPAMAVMLGANVGTTLIVQVLSFDVSRISPVLILAGVIAFRKGERTRTRDLGRVAIGLGLMLMSLQLLLRIIAPAEDAPSLRLLMGTITQDPFLDVLLAAVLTWAAHSSVATILLVVSLAAQGVVPPHAAFALVLGANLGSAINPALEGARGGEIAAKRLVWGNLLNRILGCVVGLAALNWIGPALVTFEPDAGRAIADFHTGFNLMLAVIFFPFLPAFARLLQRLLPQRAVAEHPGTPLYLDPNALEAPSVALANAARETLRMADAVESMLRGALDALTTGDRRRVAEVKQMDDVLDSLNSAIKRHVAALAPEALDDTDTRRANEILGFATNLEHAGDIAAGGLMALVAKKIKRKLSFEPDARHEIATMMDRLVSNVRLAAAVFMSGEVRAARRLLAEKTVFRDLETHATDAHFQRLREGRKDTLENSTLQLDILRDLKRINAHLAAACYPVLEDRGELLSSRLKSEEEGQLPYPSLETGDERLARPDRDEDSDL